MRKVVPVFIVCSMSYPSDRAHCYRQLADRAIQEEAARPAIVALRNSTPSALEILLHGQNKFIHAILPCGETKQVTGDLHSTYSVYVRPVPATTDFWYCLEQVKTIRPERELFEVYTHEGMPENYVLFLEREKIPHFETGSRALRGHWLERLKRRDSSGSSCCCCMQ